MSNPSIKVYIAAPFFKQIQLNAVKMIEHKLQKEDIEFYSPRSEGILQDMTPEQKAERMSYIFQQNVRNLNWCTHVIAVIDDYDTGTVWEMGFAYASNKKIVTYSDQYHGINVMLNESIIAHCIKLDHVVPALHGKILTVKGSDVI